MYFGAGHVDPRAWSHFLARIVTPRFPEGLTVLEGDGQWRGPRGLRTERSRVLIIYYKPTTESEAAIEAIREAYKRHFSQTSVLRSDSVACVSF